MAHFSESSHGLVAKYKMREDGCLNKFELWIGTRNAVSGEEAFRLAVAGFPVPFVIVTALALAVARYTIAIRAIVFVGIARGALQPPLWSVIRCEPAIVAGRIVRLSFHVTMLRVYSCHSLFRVSQAGVVVHP